MEKLLYTAFMFNGLTGAYLIFTGIKMVARPHSQLGNIATMFLAGLIFLTVSAISYLLWSSNRQLAGVLFCWLPWAVLVISFAVFMVLTVGVKWN